ncbi:MAG: coproporphyrinogen-III oxidase family protein [Pseudomonadota bacterium]
MTRAIVEFQHREPIGSSTFPMPGDLPELGLFEKALSTAEGERNISTLYIHVPFCDRICSFCGFAKTVGDDEAKAAYIDALLVEIGKYAATKYVQSLSIDAVYIGGGTPNSLTAGQLWRVLAALRKLMPLSADCEISVEGILPNFDEARVEAMKLGGVNRVSAGVQTLSRRIRVEHLHMRDGREEVEGYVARLRKHFDNFNLDFIYNLPGQDDAIWKEDVAFAIGSGATHLTHYPLTLLERTGLYSDYVKAGKHEAPDEGQEIRQFDFVRTQMQSSRYTNQYSVRDWSLPDRACRYIMLNAQANHVLALGVSGHGYLAGITYRNQGSIPAYIDEVNSGKLPLQGMRVASLEERMQRWMVMGLRLRERDTTDFAVRFGRTVIEAFGDRIDSMIDSGYLRMEGGVLSFTPRGDIWANNVRTVFEGNKNTAVGYMNTTGIDETGKSHYARISRIKASADVEAHS